MKYVFLVSHGELAQGMATALGMLAGQGREDILSAGLEDGMARTSLPKKVKECISGIERRMRFFCLRI